MVGFDVGGQKNRPTPVRAFCQFLPNFAKNLGEKRRKCPIYKEFVKIKILPNFAKFCLI
jgi:hypothetical protein